MFVTNFALTLLVDPDCFQLPPIADESTVPSLMGAMSESGRPG